MLADYFALSSYSGIRASLHQALADRSVNRIILNVDSPGGAASGCEELAADLASAARVKPMTTFVAGLAASAGYWLASQAPQITMTPSGEVGSIGVLLLHVDISRALDAAGVTPSFIVSKASPFKVEGNQFEPLGAPARAHQQEAVDMIADRFIAAVASGRRVTSAKVRSDFGRGRTLMANAAHAAGMVDRVGTLRDALGIGATQASPAAFMTERQQIAAARQRRMEAALTPRERLVQARRRRLIIEGLA
jgi:signal peptide peptidase SppA